MKTKSQKATQSSLAKELGVSRQLVAFHVKAGKAPPIGDTDAWIEFLSANGREGTLPAEVRQKIGEARLKLINEQIEDRKLTNAERRGEMIEFAIVERFMFDIVQNLFFGELDRLAQEFPPTLKGKNEIAINKEVNRQILLIKGAIQNKLEELKRMGPKEKKK